MANIKSAKKRVRQNQKKRVQASARRASIRTFEKKMRNLIVEGKIEEANSVYRIFSSLLDRAAGKNIIHTNKASRKKSRLALLLKKSQSPTVVDASGA